MIKSFFAGGIKLVLVQLYGVFPGSITVTNPLVLEG